MIIINPLSAVGHYTIHCTWKFDFLIVLNPKIWSIRSKVVTSNVVKKTCKVRVAKLLLNGIVELLDRNLFTAKMIKLQSLL